MKKMILILLALILLLSGCGEAQTEVPAYDMSAADAYMADVEARSDSIKTSLEQDALTQHDMNSKSEELYTLWDDALNYLWGELEIALPEDAFAELTEEQLVWIAEKDAAVEVAGKEFEGGSIYPLIVNGEAARITQERVYELYALLKEAAA